MTELTFEELARCYFDEQYLKSRTQKSYLDAIRAIKRFMRDVVPSEVTHEEVIRWRKSVLRDDTLAKGRINEVSWNTYIRHLSILYSYGMNSGRLPLIKNPFLGVSVRPMVRRKKTVRKSDVEVAREVLFLNVRLEELRRKPASIHPAWFWVIVFETFYHTGIRLNQMLNVKPQDVNLRQRMLVATSEGAKNNREHGIPISDGLYPHLERLMTAAHVHGFRQDDQLFNVNRFSERHRKGQMDDVQVKAFYTRLSKKCSAKVSAHRFRHTLATDLMKDPNCTPKDVQDIMGHASIKTTFMYVEPDYASLRQSLNSR